MMLRPPQPQSSSRTSSSTALQLARSPAAARAAAKAKATMSTTSSTSTSRRRHSLSPSPRLSRRSLAAASSSQAAGAQVRALTKQGTNERLEISLLNSFSNSRQEKKPSAILLRPRPEQQQKSYHHHHHPLLSSALPLPTPKPPKQAFPRSDEDYDLSDPRAVDVLAALSTIQDPDLGQDIVSCGFVKKLRITAKEGGCDGFSVSFELRLTTPACPIKEQFRNDAASAVSSLPWVLSKDDVDVAISSVPLHQPQGFLSPPSIDGDGTSPETTTEGRPGGLSKVRHVIAVSSCKGGVGKSTVAVNLAFTLLQMGARGVGIFDADVYGPSLPTMVTAVGDAVLGMDPETKRLTPVEARTSFNVDDDGNDDHVENRPMIKCVSFGWAGQGAAIMRGPMASGVVSQLLETSDWGELDYLVVDFPPGTGDIQLTLCQTVAFDAAVVVTTPQKLAYVDVAKGVRMFARVGVPCVAVAENMATFRGDDGKVYAPFGAGAGDRIAEEFGVPRVVRFPIDPGLAAAGDSGLPLVASDPAGDVAQAMMELGAAVVREVATMNSGGVGKKKGSLEFDSERNEFVYSPPRTRGTSKEGGGEETEPVRLSAVAVRDSDRSAAAIDEWTGAPLRPLASSLSPEALVPTEQPRSVGNYAVQITWGDGVSQLSTFEQLSELAAVARRGGAAKEKERASAAAL